LTFIRRAEADLRVADETYRHLFESALKMVYVVDEQLRISDVNEMEPRKLEYSRSELIGKPFLEIVHPEFHGQVSAMSDTIRAGQTVLSRETALVTKSSSKIFVEANIVPLPAFRYPQGW
jgi:PAS domain S-box-containing protein